jgi:hypothetical protein
MVLCHATVDLLSRTERPYRFAVTVQGKPPHYARRVYEIMARSDSDAAQAGIDRFVHEMSHPLRMLDAMGIR